MSDDPIAERFRGKQLDGLREAHWWDWARQRLVLNDELTLDLIPTADADSEQLVLFALTYDGYVAFGLDACGDLANETRARWERTRALPDGLTLAQLRSCLFFEQRRHHWADTNMHTERRYWLALCDAIRARVEARR